MAKVIQEESTVGVIETSWWSRLQGARVGFGLGSIWFILMLMVKQFIVEPWACRDLSAVADTCGEAVGVSGNIATVLIAVLGIYVLIQRLQPRPVIVAIAAAVSLWGLASFTEGMAWYWVFVLGIIFYTMAYGLFSMVSRIPSLYLSLFVAALISIVTRLIV